MDSVTADGHLKHVDLVPAQAAHGEAGGGGAACRHYAHSAVRRPVEHEVDLHVDKQIQLLGQRSR